MQPNPLLKKLGLSDNDRVVIFHADDIGMCHASLAAYSDMIDFGLLSSAAVMVPCPWFPATAVYCRENQAAKPQIDMGVHLTLTSEWDNFRWGPAAECGIQSGLLDTEGYFYRDCDPVQAQAQGTAVTRELTAQIERALAAGVDVTHIDSHMGCLFHPRFLSIYFQLAQTYRLPALTLRATAVEKQAELFFDPAALNVFVEALDQMETDGYPLLDSVEMMSLDQSENRLEEGRRRLDQLKAGVHYFIVHPSVDTPELRAIAPDWRCRVADYELFTSDKWREVVEASGVKVFGWRVLRDLLRGE